MFLIWKLNLSRLWCQFLSFWLVFGSCSNPAVMSDHFLQPVLIVLTCSPSSLTCSSFSSLLSSVHIPVLSHQTPARLSMCHEPQVYSAQIYYYFSHPQQNIEILNIEVLNSISWVQTQPVTFHISSLISVCSEIFYKAKNLKVSKKLNHWWSSGL